MNAKVIALIGAVALAVVVIAVIAGRSTDSIRTEVAAPDERLLPNLNDRINDVARLHIQDKDTSVTLQRTGETWGLAQQSGYPVRFEQVRKTIMDAANLRKIEEKTSNPSLYTRLDVEDISTPDAKSTLIEFQDEKGGKIAALLLGRTHWPPGGSSNPQQFVRPADEKTSWLVTGSIQPQTDQSSWLDTTLFTLQGNRIRSVSIEHADGEEVRVEKASEGDSNYVLASLPEGAEVAAENRMNELSNLFLNLRLEEAVPASGVGNATPVAYTEGRTYNGLVVQANTVEANGKRYATFNAFSDSEEITRINDARVAEAREAQATVTAEGSEEAPVEENPQPELIDAAQVQEEAEGINKRVAGWAYVLPSSQQDRLLRRNSFYLKEPEPVGPPEQAGPMNASEMDAGGEVDIEALIRQMQENPEMVPQMQEVQPAEQP